MLISLKWLQKYISLNKSSNEIAEILTSLGIEVEEIQVTGIPVYRVVVEKARQLSVDVIVIALPERKGWVHFFKKNITAQVIRTAPCSVFVVRPPAGEVDS